ncbi:AAA family ATPase [Candidatus Woesearchaeota archaeon]|nr:AAA family ATPase [Candidatus Woesearchaeota archaeon]
MTFADVLQNPLYKDRDVLYALIPPSGLVHRTEQKNELIMELAPILMNSAVNCVFLYGNPGTGKTAIVTELLSELESEAKKRTLEIKSVYVNCSENRTETTILIDALSQINPAKNYPRVGWTRSKAVNEFNHVLAEEKSHVIMVLDEVDYALRESGDDVLYRLSRIAPKGAARLSTILISNDMRVVDFIKPKTASTVGRVKIIFSPYTAEELQDILADRAKYAFNKDAVSNQVIEKIAEIEAGRGGDARKALELLDSCAKIALSQNKSKIGLDVVDQADSNLEKDTVLHTLTTLTKHQKLLYLAILQSNKDEFNGGEVYQHYVEVCAKNNVEPLSVRRVRTFLVDFSELGLIESEVTWLRDLNKKSRAIKIVMDTATRKKARKLIRDIL